MLNLLLFLLILGGVIVSFRVGFRGLKQIFTGNFKKGFKLLGIGTGVLVVMVFITVVKIWSEQPTPEEKVQQEAEEKLKEEEQAKLNAEQQAKEEAEAKAKAERKVKEDAIIQDLIYVKQQYSGRAKVHKDEEEKAFIVELNDEGYMTTIVQQANVGNTVAGEMFKQEVEIAMNVSTGINPEWKIRVVTGEYSMLTGYSYHIEVQAGKNNK